MHIIRFETLGETFDATLCKSFRAEESRKAARREFRIGLYA